MELDNIFKDKPYSTFWKRIKWRLNFYKVKRYNLDGSVNHCVYCDASRSKFGACSMYYCPCSFYEVLKLKKKKK